MNKKDTGIKLDEAIERYTSNAEFEQTHGNLQGCLEFRQLAKWLRDYQRLLDNRCKQNEDTIKTLEQEPKFVVKSDGTIEQIKNCNDCLLRKEWEKIGKMLSATLEKQMEQEHILDKIDEIITDALDKSTDQKESQTLRWVLDKISEVQYE